jgi:hypothetical protein
LGDVGEHVGLAERHLVEKAQSTDRLHDERPGDVPLMHEIELILADLLGAKLIWGGTKVLGKLGDTAEIGLNSFWGRSYWIPGSWNVRMPYTDDILVPNP